MEIDEELREFIESEKTACPNQWCRDQGEAITEILLETLGNPRITGLEYQGEHRLNPSSNWTRPVYGIVHQDGRRIRIAFTRLSSIQVFSHRKGKSTHCYSAELKKRLGEFITG